MRTAISLRARPDAGRCPVCHEALAETRALPRVRCPDCGVAQHAPCVEEVGRCATFGCASSALLGRPAPLPWAPRPRDPAWDRLLASQIAWRRLAPRLAWASLAIAVAAPVVLGAIAFSAGATASGLLACVAVLVFVANVVGAALGLVALIKSVTGPQTLAGLFTMVANVVPWLAGAILGALMKC